MNPTEELLTQLTHIAQRLGIPSAVGVFPQSPAPDTFVVFTPISELFEFHADNTPQVDTSEVRLSLYTTHNYLKLAERLTQAVLDADLTVSARRYVGFEADTGYHHWALDIQHWTRTHD